MTNRTTSPLLTERNGQGRTVPKNKKYVYFAGIYGNRGTAHLMLVRSSFFVAIVLCQKNLIDAFFSMTIVFSLASGKIIWLFQRIVEQSIVNTRMPAIGRFIGHKRKKIPKTLLFEPLTSVYRTKFCLDMNRFRINYNHILWWIIEILLWNSFIKSSCLYKGREFSKKFESEYAPFLCSKSQAKLAGYLF